MKKKISAYMRRKIVEPMVKSFLQKKGIVICKMCEDTLADTHNEICFMCEMELDNVYYANRGNEMWTVID